MEYAYFALLTLFAFGAGWYTVAYLTVEPIDMAASLTIALTCTFMVTAIAIWQFRDRALIAAVVLAVVGIVIGYMANAAVVLGKEDTRFIPELVRKAGDPGNGHTAVIYFTHGEPETYNPIGWLNQFREFDEQGISFVPFVARPVFLKKLRDAYLTVGASQHRQRHLGMSQTLENTLKADGYEDVRVYASFLDDEPRPDAALIRALNEGASRVVVAEVFVSISNHTAEGEEQINAVDTEALGVPLAFTGPLWDSKTLHEMFVAKVEAERGDVSREEVGVLLVGHGQPDEWDVEWPTETEHELGLRTNIMDALESLGYDRENLDLAWMSFKEPYVPDCTERIAERGISKLVYLSAGISAESIHSQYDVPELVAKADIPDGIDVVNLGAWNDHPLAIKAIAERVEALMDEQVDSLE